MLSSNFNKLAAAITLATLSGCATTLTQPKSVDEIEFQDLNFAQCVYKYNEPSLDKIETLECNEAKIESIDEIKYFPNLAHLVLLKNDITHIDTSNNPELVRLILGDNKLSEIDVSDNPKLKYLNITNNDLTKIDVSQNPELVSLYAYKMPINHIDVSNQPNLRDLGLSQHELTDIDLSQNPKLRLLNLTSGKLSKIDLSHNPNMGFLYLSSNQLGQLDLSRNPEVQVLNVRNNQLQQLELNQQTRLRELKADYNQLNQIDLSDNLVLTKVELNNNQLSTLDLTENTKVEKLTAFNNPLHTLTVDSLEQFKLLSIEGTPAGNGLKAATEGKESKDISNQFAPRVSVTEAGLIEKEGNEYTVTPSQFVFPKVGHFMGFRYSVTLPKDASGNVPANLANQHQFPITVRMTHPEITDPNTGQSSTVSSWTDTMFKHNKNLAMWYFGAENEIVSGKWTLELLYRDSVVARKSFQVSNLDDPEEVAQMTQAVKLQELVINADKFLCKEDKFQTCFEFSNAQQCEAKLAPYKERCRGIASSSVEQLKQEGKNSGDGLREFFSHFVVCLGSHYIPQSNLDPEQVGTCLQK
ncbi:DUF3859 domain-containing protein [Vibrio intestinalis]|uniref:DUF3859 domain-containing protein n=1 Tax=Vibrio intestinalis TaxID=2933291 RepID=UPI0021A6759F|nr:DUF3859 domain-containing protein [Vibrio intestinalis]